MSRCIASADRHASRCRAGVPACAGAAEPITNAAEVRAGIEQRIRQLQRQAVPAEPSEASLRRQLRAQQPGRRRDAHGVAGVLRSARAEARAEVAARAPFAQVRLPAQPLRRGAPAGRRLAAVGARGGGGGGGHVGAEISSAKVAVPNISDLIQQRLATAREAAAAEFLAKAPT